jgi:hypothetical protein
MQARVVSNLTLSADKRSYSSVYLFSYLRNILSGIPEIYEKSYAIYNYAEFCYFCAFKMFNNYRHPQKNDLLYELWSSV